MEHGDVESNQMRPANFILPSIRQQKVDSKEHASKVGASGGGSSGSDSNNTHPQLPSPSKASRESPRTRANNSNNRQYSKQQQQQQQQQRQRHVARNVRPLVDTSRSFFKAPIQSIGKVHRGSPAAAATRQRLGQPEASRFPETAIGGPNTFHRRPTSEDSAVTRKNLAENSREDGTVSSSPAARPGRQQSNPSEPRVIIPKSHTKHIYKELRSLCSKRNTAMLKTLVNSGVSIDTPSSSGQTVLMYAVGLGDAGLPLVEFLLAECGANPNCRTTQGGTALHVASERGRKLSVAVVDLLTKFGADPLIKDNLGRTAKDVYKKKRTIIDGCVELRRAIGRGDSAKVISLLDQNVSVDSTNAAGKTMLMLAVEITHVGLVRLLLERKADPNIQEPVDQMSALHLALQQEHHTNPSVTEIVQELEKHGASNILHNRFGLTPLEWNKRLLREANGALPQGFKRVCIEGDEVGVVRYLSAPDGTGPVILNARDTHGRTPLIYASLFERIGACRLLLQAKAAPNLHEMNHRGNTALHYAYMTRNSPLIELLQEHGADPSLCNSLGFDCIAAQQNVVSRIRRQRGNHDGKFRNVTKASFRNGRIPQKDELLEAICVKFNRMEAKRLLREKFPPIYIDGCDELGNTYLMRLVLMGTEPAAKMASWIIDFLDADMDCVNMRGWTALHLAYEHDNNRMIRMLEYKGADTSIRDAIGFVAEDLPLRHASQEREEQIKAKEAARKRAAEHMWVEKEFAVACRAQQYSEVQRLVQEEPDVDINAHVCRGGDTMLIEAVRHNDLTLLKLLIANKADVNIKNQSGDTAAHVAASLGKEEMYGYLTSEKCKPPFDTQISNNFGFTADKLRKWHKHAEDGHKAERVKALAPKIEFNQQLESCAVIGDVAGAQEVLATLLTDFRATQGAAPEEPSMEALLSDPSLLVEQEEVETPEDMVAKVLNCQSKIGGSTVLIRAVENCQHKVAQLLLQQRADPDVQNVRGMTALHAACALVPPDKDMFDMLILHGASDDVTSKVGITPTAMFLKVKRMIKFANLESVSDRFERHLTSAVELMEMVMDIGICDPDELDGLLAHLRGHLADMMEDDSRFRSEENRRIDIAAIVNNRIRNGESAPFMAIRLDSSETLDILLDFGADFNAKNKSGSSLLHVAYEIGNPDIVEQLIGLGADTSATDVMGNTPLQHGRHHAQIRRRKNRRKAAKLMASAYNFFYDLSDELLDNVIHRDLQGIRLTVESENPPLNGQTPDLALRQFFALSRHSGSVTEALSTLSPSTVAAVGVRVGAFLFGGALEARVQCSVSVQFMNHCDAW
eukprot:INCI17624.5.p1 GENE.INCI17624.5~~INCI17624.5.p1  ORF type:complete len:1312 (+),score=254.64 INCI17624.5:198-4133(+)